MQQLPTAGLWIVLREVSKEGCVREVLETGGVIGHDILHSIDESDKRAVHVLALRQTSLATYAGWGSI